MVPGRHLPRAIAVAIVAMLGTLLVPTTAHADDEGGTVLLFSHLAVVDEPELDNLDYGIGWAGYYADRFDGEDGSAAAWAEALAEVEVFVLPAQSNGPFIRDGGSEWLSTAALGVLVDWIRGGGQVVLVAPCDPESAAVLTAATGVDYGGLAGCGVLEQDGSRFVAGQLPPTLAWTTSSMPLMAFTEAQLAPLSVWYASQQTDVCGAPTDALYAGTFAAGAGRVATIGGNWNSSWTADEDTMYDWTEVLRDLIAGDSRTSSWERPEPFKSPVTAKTAAGETLFTVSPIDCDLASTRLFRVDPGNAVATPVGTSLLRGWAGQGAWSPQERRAFVPFLYESGVEDGLLSVDPSTGALEVVGDFSLPEEWEPAWVSAIAIGRDGTAYALVTQYIPSERQWIFRLNLDDASLTHVTEIEASDGMSLLSAIAADPRTGRFTALGERGDLYGLDIASGELTHLGRLDAPSFDDEQSYVSTLQIGADGTFWITFTAADDDAFFAAMLANFTLADASEDRIAMREVDIITDGPVPSWSLILVPASVTPAGGPAPAGGPRELVATGPEAFDLALGGAVFALALGWGLLGLRARHRARLAPGHDDLS